MVLGLAATGRSLVTSAFYNVQSFNYRHPIFSTIIHLFGKWQVIIGTVYVNYFFFYFFRVLILLTIIAWWFPLKVSAIFPGQQMILLNTVVFLSFFGFVLINRGKAMILWFPDLYENINLFGEGEGGGFWAGVRYVTNRICAPKLYNVSGEIHVKVTQGPLKITAVGAVAVFSFTVVTNADVNYMNGFQVLIDQMSYTLQEGHYSEASKNVILVAKDTIVQKRAEIASLSLPYRFYENSVNGAYAECVKIQAKAIHEATLMELKISSTK